MARNLNFMHAIDPGLERCSLTWVFLNEFIVLELTFYEPLLTGALEFFILSLIQEHNVEI
jgi:hypothetical protein